MRDGLSGAGQSPPRSGPTRRPRRVQPTPRPRVHSAGGTTDRTCRLYRFVSMDCACNLRDNLAGFDSNVDLGTAGFNANVDIATVGMNGLVDLGNAGITGVVDMGTAGITGVTTVSLDAFDTLLNLDTGNNALIEDVWTNYTTSIEQIISDVPRVCQTTTNDDGELVLVCN